MKCKLDGCVREVGAAGARGLCPACYARLRYNGKLNEHPRVGRGPGKKVKPPCSADGCGDTSFALGLCRKHYGKQYFEKRPHQRQKLIERTTGPQHRWDQRWRRISWEYGLTENAYWDIMSAQGGACEFCLRPFGQSREAGPNIDHCHDTGEVRRLLCNSCNTAYSKHAADPLVLERMMEAATADAAKRERDRKSKAA